MHVLQRRQQDRATRSLPGHPGPSGGQVIALEPYRRRLGELQQDATLDAAWNELLAAVEQAWCWRDPESLVVVATCLARLGPHVLRDWS